MVKQSEQVQKFYCTQFGELNVAINENGGKMYCLIDICRALELLKREGDRIVKLSNCQTQEFFVKRVKSVVSRTFIDENGLLSLVTESRKNKADKYRKWALGLGNKLNRSVMMSKRASKSKRDCQGRFLPASGGSKVRADDKGPFPTLEEYFKDFVPLDYLIPLLSDTLKDYITLAQQGPEERRKQAEHRCSVLNTLNLTLIANKEKYPSRSYASKINQQ